MFWLTDSAVPVEVENTWRTNKADNALVFIFGNEAVVLTLLVILTRPLPPRLPLILIPTQVNRCPRRTCRCGSKLCVMWSANCMAMLELGGVSTNNLKRRRALQYLCRAV